MFSSSRCVVGAAAPAHLEALPIFSVSQTRAIEQLAFSGPDRPDLITKAGLALARLTLAYAPHGSQVWIACGPGNNGADGLSAALQLRKFGRSVTASMLQNERQTSETQRRLRDAVEAGVLFSPGPPPLFDVAIDAMFGIGANRALPTQACEWIQCLSASEQPVIAADVPSGLDADTGSIYSTCVHAKATLSFLSLKPGLFTSQGRDVCGDIWWDMLGVQTQAPPSAFTNASPVTAERLHASHKGTFGDVCVVGGASGMTGAAILAGQAALNAGAGRVFICALDAAGPSWSDRRPELMFRPLMQARLDTAVVVAGCGGSDAIESTLPHLLQASSQLILDADALNHIARNKQLRHTLRARQAGTTILTPHPLEAARLLNCETQQIQANRLKAAQTLADELQCVVALKGSGTIIAAPGVPPQINITGNGRLATAGTGDVLAGCMGALWAQGYSAHQAALAACFQHGHHADEWPKHKTLTASRLANRLSTP